MKKIDKEILKQQLLQAQSKRLKKIIGEIEKLTQTKLADDFGIKHPAVNAYANGGNLIPNENLFILLDKYNINLNWLIAGKGNMFLPDTKAIEEEARRSIDKSIAVTREEFEARMKIFEDKLKNR